jgi:hypothetical protein
MVAAWVRSSVAGGTSAAATSEWEHNLEQLEKALWGLLLNLKPSLAYAMCCHMIPASCRSYEAFERAVLGWPPQSASSMEADMAAAMRAQQERKAARESSSSSSSSKQCICGQEGHFIFLIEGSMSHGSGMRALKIDHPVVCEKPSCVVRELRWLATLGKPHDIPQGLLATALHAVRSDWLVMPAAYR